MNVTGKVPPTVSDLADQSLRENPLVASDPTLLDVIAVTREVFPESTPEIEMMSDPEDTDHSFVVVTVQWAGDARESVDKRLQWHRRVSLASSPHVAGVRLSIVCP